MSRRARTKTEAGLPVLLLFLAAISSCGGAGEAAPGELGRVPPAVPRDLDLAGWAPDEPGLYSRERVAPGAGERAGLAALGYAAGYTPAPGESGVTVHDPARAFQGFNLAVSGHAPGAELLDMQGRVVHRWRFAYADLPGAPPIEDGQLVHAWRSARLLPGGELLAIFEGHSLIKLDRDSRLLWAFHGHAHHALDVAPDGSIFVLTRRPAIVPWVHPREPVFSDHVAELAPDGALRREVSVLAALERSSYRHLVEARADAAGDILHTNSVRLLDGAHADWLPAFRRGNLLISMRHTHAIAVLDFEAETIPWAATGMWRLQHDPRQLEDGGILLFDNAGYGLCSQVLELDPATLEVRWAYRGRPREAFFTLYCGASQRLSGGTTLITETCQGRAFEVTRAGEVVWSYRNPERAGEHGELIAALFALERIPAADVEGWLGH
jgi:hypothetical protein